MPRYEITYAHDIITGEDRTEQVTAQRYSDKGDWIIFLDPVPPTEHKVAEQVLRVRAVEVRRIELVPTLEDADLPPETRRYFEEAKADPRLAVGEALADAIHKIRPPS